MALADADEWAGEGKVMVGAINNAWEFEIFGDVHNLRQMSEKFTGYDIVISNETDIWNDTMTNDFYLGSWHFNNVDDLNKIYALGLELIELLNGVLSIFDEAHSPFVLKNLYSGNNRQIHVNATTLLPVKVSEFGSDIKSHKDKHLKEIEADLRFYLLHLSKSRDDVYELIKSFSSKPDFRSLYTILEAVEYYSKREGFDLYVDPAKRNEFTHVANNWGAIGAQARHGEKNWKPPENPMSLNDAIMFIRPLVEVYLKNVANS